jgi:hypothetical protein
MSMNVPECFPPDDRLGQFVLAMAIAGNDVEYTLRQAVLANPPDVDDEHRRRERFTFKIRVANGFLFEAIDALRAWQQENAVADLLRRLPAAAQEHLRTVRGLEQQIGSKTLEHVRQNTFHFPHPDPSKTPDSTTELAEVTAEMTDVVAAVDRSSVAQHTFRFGDQVALAMAIRRHQDFETETAKIIAGGVAFVHLTRHVWIAYCKHRGFEFEFSD